MFPNTKGGAGVSANETQVGGSHYTRLAIQPVEIIAANGLDWFEGEALKYLLRWRFKGGVTDLRKMVDVVQKLIELEEAKPPEPKETRPHIACPECSNTGCVLNKNWRWCPYCENKKAVPRDPE